MHVALFDIGNNYWNNGIISHSVIGFQQIKFLY